MLVIYFGFILLVAYAPGFLRDDIATPWGGAAVAAPAADPGAGLPARFALLAGILALVGLALALGGARRCGRRDLAILFIPMGNGSPSAMSHQFP